MVELSRKISLSTTPDQAFNLLKDVGRFPQFIAGVEQVECRKSNSRVSRNKWNINMQGVDISWEEEEIVDDKAKTISFKRINGDFNVLEGKREVRATKDGAEIHLTLKLDWHSHDNINEEIILRKSNLAIRWMLRSIRSKVGTDSILKYEHTNKAGATIVSQLLKYKNLEGKKTIGFLDYLKPFDNAKRFIVLPPGYGETKRDSLTLAYYLVVNGFNVVRYDNTDHTGESEGEIFHTTLPKMKNDIVAAINYIEKKFHVKKIGIIASSLAKRVALKAAAEDSRIEFLLGLVGIVNLKSTLHAVYQQDLIDIVEAGKEKSFDMAEILGFEVSREFPKTAIEENYHSLESTEKDIKGLNIPIVFIVAEKDTWVRLEDVKMIFEAYPGKDKELHVMQDTMHLIYENPKAARNVMKQIVVSAKKYMCQNIMNTSNILEPGLREIALQNRIEKARLRKLSNVTKDTEKDFWKNYLNKYVVITKSNDFRSLLSLMEILMGAPKDNENILDAGCGNGHFGAWLLWTTLARYKSVDEDKRIYNKRNYIGVDFVEEVLMEASDRHKEIYHSIKKELKVEKEKDLFTFQYDCVDMEKKLPFKDCHFDKICCNLVLSYLKNPYFALRELFRVLKPEGRIVVSSLKPHPDLSQIYRSFVLEGQDEDEISQARLLLSNAGKIRQKESEGHYQFFSEKNLIKLFIKAKAINIKDYRTFGDQAIVVAGQKPNYT